MMERDLWISLDRGVSPVVLSARGAALGLRGFVHDRAERVASLHLRLVQGGRTVEASRLFLQDGLLGPTEAGIGDRIDGGFYLSAVFPPDPGLSNGAAFLEATVHWGDGASSEIRLAAVDLIRAEPVAEPTGENRALGRVGIAMATHNPDPALFARQIASIRAQTHRDWICVISDDQSRPDVLRAIAETIGGDSRFHLLPPGPRLGFYRNFERACASLPDSCGFVAFSDQDDVWLPERLARQVAVAEGVDHACCYSDMEVVRPDGSLISPTYWVHRRPRYGSLGGLLLANVVTGMTILARRELIEEALPFPAAPGLTYHDHWIALLAARRGSLRYLAEPLARYVQHGSNHTGALVRWKSSRTVLRESLARVSRFTRRGIFGHRLRSAASEPGIVKWIDTEPVRLRILVDRLTEMPGGTKRSDRALRRLSQSFGPLRLLASGADWSDRYRRGIAIELVLGGLLKRVLNRSRRAMRVASDGPEADRRAA
ncbi:glycosyltransferase involved in cell wall biosynthesis [Methylobacterium sp. BE186]|uniref:glycosyltransferase n=1 Tax=Methylobacterium sp. BE186 TaxID=2817715 RepID=UPI002865FF82|nr:glycosyltransferase [Methylobacterium sp. BE186]MDR7036993.1 glycosyltransferase involved in cell wall biosynthesis [Methylobacterium sp. BE186]